MVTVISLSSQPSLKQKNNIYIYIYKDIVGGYLLILYWPNKIRKDMSVFIYLESY